MITRNFYRYSRFFVGLLLVLGGANKFFNLIAPMDMPPAALAFLEALGASGYFIPFLGVYEIVIGLMFWSKKATPLASVALAPWSVNVLLFHFFLAPGSILPAAIIVAGNIYFLARNWALYTPMLEGLSKGRISAWGNSFQRSHRSGYKKSSSTKA